MKIKTSPFPDSWGDSGCLRHYCFHALPWLHSLLRIRTAVRKITSIARLREAGPQRARATRSSSGLPMARASATRTICSLFMAPWSGIAIEATFAKSVRIESMLRESVPKRFCYPRKPAEKSIPVAYIPFPATARKYFRRIAGKLIATTT